MCGSPAAAVASQLMERENSQTRKEGREAASNLRLLAALYGALLSPLFGEVYPPLIPSPSWPDNEHQKLAVFVVQSR
jgi:hypothetical protein